MARHYYYLLFLLISSYCEGQGQKSHFTSTNEYLDFVVADQQIWAVAKTGNLRIFDISTGEPIGDTPQIDSPIIAIAKDRNSNIALGFGGKISVYNRNLKTWSILGPYENKILGIVFGASDACFLLTNKGIEDLRSRSLYFPDSSLNKQIHYHGNWFRDPVYYVDRENNIWIGFGYGEWGGDLFVFSTTNKKFIIPAMGRYEIDLNPVKSIFSDGNSVYLSAGMDHFDFSGSIVRFESFSATPLFISELHRGKDSAEINGEYIGPAAFNKSDHCIYFYSQNGIFKGNTGNDLSAIEKWQKVASPKLTWSYGQPDAVGYKMNVLKMEFADDNTLVFLTQANGIGILNNGKIALIK
jgi:hypothetical protein